GFPYPLSGTWSDGLRARRIRQMLEARDVLSLDDCAAMQRDTLSLRAVRCLPGLLKALEASPESRVQQAVGHLRAWDGRVEPDRVGATLFEVFFAHWTRAVAQEQFDRETAAFVAGAANGLSTALLAEDAAGWFAAGKREQAVCGAVSAALDWLADRLGPGMAPWGWGGLDVLSLRHTLSGRGDLGRLLDQRGLPVPGTMHTVCNTGLRSDCSAGLGANYRLVADLSASPPALRAVDSQSQSGHPGSPHYGDQFPTWLRGEYHTLPLDRAQPSRLPLKSFTLHPPSLRIPPPPPP